VADTLPSNGQTAYDCMNVLRMCDKTFCPAIHSAVYFLNSASVHSNSGTYVFCAEVCLKLYLRLLTSERRLTELALKLAYIYRDIDVDKTVDLIVDSFVM
jgi:tRNA isopentenyl-2-thiomethyl-A-37 hydroxylase MiaE